MRAAPDLAESHALLARLVTLPGRVSEARARHGISRADVARVIAPSPMLPAEQCLNVYAEAYFFRLVSVLAEQYPRLCARLGDDDFQALCSDYLMGCPPRSFDVSHAGDGLAGFLADRPALAELARFEHALLVAHVAADAEPIGREKLASLTPDQLPGLALRLVPAHALLEQAHADDARVLIWRIDVVVHHRAIVDGDEWACLARLAGGSTLAELGELLAARHGVDAASPRLFALLSRWLDEALLS